MIGGLFELWRSQSTDLKNVVTAVIDGIQEFGQGVRMAPDIMIVQSDASEGESYTRGDDFYTSNSTRRLMLLLLL